MRHINSTSYLNTNMYRKHVMNIMRPETFAILFGYYFHIVQNIVNMVNRDEGVNYYAEAHTTSWNSIIHTVFMPFTMLGMFIWIPAIFMVKNPRELKLRVICFYAGLYLRINAFVTLVVILWYYVSYRQSEIIYNVLILNNYSYRRIAAIGITISFIALFIQEILGHLLSGDMPSRLEGVPNAVLYAPYYSVCHLLGC